MSKVYSRVFSRATGWIIGIIDNHQSRPLTEEETDRALNILNGEPAPPAPKLPLPLPGYVVPAAKEELRDATDPYDLIVILTRPYFKDDIDDGGGAWHFPPDAKWQNGFTTDSQMEAGQEYVRRALLQPDASTLREDALAVAIGEALPKNLAEAEQHGINMTEVARKVIAALSASPKDSADAWVSVKDRLPPDDNDVLVYWPSVGIVVECGGDVEGDPEYTHWMPLPAAPVARAKETT